ncbi:beta-L-arabinofuranosidase domain-containing protein [Agromyces allii]|uniref:LamG-like jellyroll fold domain-containing protein n=1 Tax=Agromyces allii TaxID=393607 RepID=A0ABN2QYI1_9MICO|nr:beta-L-arabinofuranosidase domain-containing protein [Agromyces allii]
MVKLARTVALAAAGALLGGLVTASVAPAALAAPGDLSIEASKVLELKLDGDLADTSANAAAVSLQRGAAAYGTGIHGQAFSFNGSTALKLGTASYLQPQDLTVSFWYNPSSAMSAEQVFAWSKTAYNSDGWYLTSESDTTPLALSIGPSAGQPYKVAVDGGRAAFFPAGQWTHIVATYDHTTKAVAFYRNGVQQPTTVKTPVSATASGVLGSESTSTKTLGYNGPNYNGSYLKGLLDDYALFNGVATVADVVTLTKRNNPAFDPAAVAQSDLDAISVPESTTVDFGVPTVGAKGSTISWTSSDETTISIDGGTAHVTRPEGAAAEVHLTATASYGGGDQVTRGFDVVVQPAGEAISQYLDDAGLENVTVTDGYLENANGQTIDYLLSLDPEKFLYSWYVQAGLTPTTASGYGGWERSTGTRFQGHFFGHYISALSQAYATTTDAAVKAQLLAKLTAAVDGLKRCQDAWAAANPSSAGYVAPFALSALPSGKDGLLVPFYNLHKVLAGLLDAHEYAPAAVSTKALSVASGFGTWVKNYAASLSNPAIILNTEYGGMNEALYELYSLTKNPTHKRAAEYFDEVTLFQQLANGQDVLNGKHANTTIPKLVGALKRYTVFMDDPELYATLTQAEKDALPMYRTAAEKFWQIVIDDHTYANGANSQSEHFHGADTLYQFATNGVTSGYGENSTAEGCNEYNMLKLSHALFAVTKDVKYADFYESTFINTILASQNPETGMVTYFQPQTAGYAKVFGTPIDQFWCDHGTGIESFTKVGDSIYFTDSTSVYVNQFRSSELRSESQNLRLVQTADVPASPNVQLEVSALDDGDVADGTVVKLRVPDWVASTPTLTVNGEARDVAALEVDGYLEVPVAAGDEIAYTLPAEVAIDDDTENPNWVAFTYGPVLLATELSRDNVNASYTAGVLVEMSVADKSLSSDVIVADADDWKANAATNIERIADGENANGLTTMRFKLHGVDQTSAALTFEPYYSLYDARYATYMTLVEPDSAEAQALILKGKQQLRVAETTIDSLTSFDDNNSEADKNYKVSNSTVGVYNGQGFRHAPAAAGAYFQYDMIVDPSLPKNYLGVRYYGGDNGRTFDVYLNDVLLKHETITNAGGATSWYIRYDQIPQSILDGIAAKDSYKRDQSGQYVLDEHGAKVPVVTVRFQSNGTSFVGGVFGVYTSSSNSYGTSAELARLGVDGGTLSPALAAGRHEYTITVPLDATSVKLDLDPAVPSGLVHVDGILIDDTEPRTVAVAAGETPTTTVVKAYAQDHTTNVAYTLQIVRAAPEPELAVTAEASARCVAGKAVIVVKATNGGDVPVELAETSAYGTATAALAAGKTVSKTFSTRAGSIGAGSVAVVATGSIDGRTVTTEVPAAYPALSCG